MAVGQQDFCLLTTAHYLLEVEMIHIALHESGWLKTEISEHVLFTQVLRKNCQPNQIRSEHETIKILKSLMASLSWDWFFFFCRSCISAITKKLLLLQNLETLVLLHKIYHKRWPNQSKLPFSNLRLRNNICSTESKFKIWWSYWYLKAWLHNGKCLMTWNIIQT